MRVGCWRSTQSCNCCIPTSVDSQSHIRYTRLLSHARLPAAPPRVRLGWKQLLNSWLNTCWRRRSCIAGYTPCRQGQGQGWGVIGVRLIIKVGASILFT